MAKEAEALAAQAQRLRELKKMGRVTVPQIAKAVDVSERQVQRWLAGDSDIDGDNLKRLARYLGTSADYIEYGALKRRQATPDPFPATVPHDTAAELVKRLEAIEEEIRLLRMDTLARAMVILQRLDEALPPNGETRKQRRA